MLWCCWFSFVYHATILIVSSAQGLEITLYALSNIVHLQSASCIYAQCLDTFHYFLVARYILLRLCLGYSTRTMQGDLKESLPVLSIPGIEVYSWYKTLLHGTHPQA